MSPYKPRLTPLIQIVVTILILVVVPTVILAVLGESAVAGFYVGLGTGMVLTMWYSLSGRRN